MIVVSREQELKMIEETRLLVNLFLTTQESDIDLEKRTGISSSTVGRRLTNEKRIREAFGEKGDKIYEQIMAIRKNNLQKGKKIGGQKSMLNNVYTKSENGKFSGSTKLRLDVIYDSELLQNHFLFHMALTFRAKPATLAELFQLDEKKLLETLIGVSLGGYNSLLYLLYHDNTDQDLVKQNIISYYRDLINAESSKDMVTKKSLIDMVSDEKVAEIKKQIEEDNKSIIELTNEELESLLNYQLKYTLSINELANTFGIDASIYQKRVEILIQSLPELKERYILLTGGDDRNPGGRNATA